MNEQKKVELVMNLMYNLLLAVVLSAIAEMINAGGVQWPGLVIDTIISFILEMLIVYCLPFQKWGLNAAMKNAQPGTPKFRAIMSIVTAIPFAIVMSACMSFIGIKMAGAPIIAWLPAFGKVCPVFIVLASVCAYVLIPVFMGLAAKICGVQADHH